MEIIKKRYEIVVQTLKTLDEALVLLSKRDVPEKFRLPFRDSVIQRFEYSLDTFWKFLKMYLSDILHISVEISSPRAILRAAFDSGLLTIYELDCLMDAVICRNETSHAYNQQLAYEIVLKIPQFYEIMRAVMEKIVLPD